MKCIKSTVLLLTCVFFAPLFQSVAMPPLEVEELIGELSPTTDLKLYDFENQHEYPFYSSIGNGKTTLGINRYSITPDGKRLVWVDDATNFAFLDGKPQAKANGCDKHFCNYAFSNDKKHFALQVKQKNKWVMVVDGVAQKIEYDKITNPRFFEGEHLCFLAKRDKKWRLIIDGVQQGAEYDEILGAEYGTNPVTFTESGKHYAFWGLKANKWFVVLDGTEQSTGYDGPGQMAFLPDGALLSKHIDGQNTNIICNGKTLATCSKLDKKCTIFEGQNRRDFEADNIALRELRPDGRMIFVLTRKDYFFLVDGEELPGGEDLGPVLLSRDGHRIAYAACKTTKGAMNNKAAGFVVIDGKPSAAHQGKSTSGWLRSTLKTAFPSPLEKLLPSKPDSIQGLHYDVHGVSDPTFSPDSQHVAYIGADDAKVFVYLDEKPGLAYDAIFDLSFEGNSQVSYIGLKGDKVISIRGNQEVDEIALPAKTDKYGPIERDTNGKILMCPILIGAKSNTLKAMRQMIANGKVEQMYNCRGMSNPLTSPDNRHYAYAVYDAAEKKSKSFVVVDGNEGKLYDEVIPDSLRFENAKTVSYLAREGRRFLRIQLAIP
jgi:hypothetical protein